MESVRFMTMWALLSMLIYSCQQPIYSVQSTSEILNGDWTIKHVKSCQRDSTFGQLIPVNTETHIRFDAGQLLTVKDDSTELLIALVSVRKPFHVIDKVMKNSPCIIGLDYDVYHEWGGTEEIWYLQNISRDSIQYRFSFEGRCERIVLQRIGAR